MRILHAGTMLGTAPCPRLQLVRRRQAPPPSTQPPRPPACSAATCPHRRASRQCLHELWSRICFDGAVGSMFTESNVHLQRLPAAANQAALQAIEAAHLHRAPGARALVEKTHVVKKISFELSIQPTTSTVVNRRAMSIVRGWRCAFSPSQTHPRTGTPPWRFPAPASTLCFRIVPEVTSNTGVLSVQEIVHGAVGSEAAAFSDMAAISAAASTIKQLELRQR